MENTTTKIIGLVLGIIVLVLGGFWVWNSYFNKSTLITVAGQGSVNVKPQIVTFTVNIINSAGTASGVVADNNTLTRNALLILKGAGVQDADIQTSFVQVLPPGSTLGQTQFQGINMIGVTLKNLNNFDNLFTQLYATGVQSISNIVFTVDNSRDLEKQAVTAAIKDAQSRVKEIAKSQGKSVGNVVSIVTGEVGEAGALSGKSGISGFSGQISSSPSQIEITRQASIVFELR